MESEKNLSQEGHCWIFENALVWGNARVSDEASVQGNAFVYRNAFLCDHSIVEGDSEVYGNAIISECSRITDQAEIFGMAYIKGSVFIRGHKKIYLPRIYEGIGENYYRYEQ